MGSDGFYPEERPVHHVSVSGFWMDEHAVTAAEFRRFVKATGYMTVAERAPDPAQYPGAMPEILVPGSLVFDQPDGPVSLNDPRNWWSWVPGAQWRHPEGPGSTLHGRDRHPVTQVAYEDAAAYASWAGKALPSEAEWERAARGGLEGAIYSWGDDFQPDGRVMANTWQGRFPWENLMTDGYLRTAPVRRFPPNGYGLFEMTGNVWEWTADFFTPRHASGAPACCVPQDPHVQTPAHDDLPRPDAHIPRRVVKGGSHLCAPNYCLRYRPAARQGQAVETSSTHIGFRCVLRVPGGTAAGQPQNDAPDQRSRDPATDPPTENRTRWHQRNSSPALAIPVEINVLPAFRLIRGA
jgi:formylglycine-generating enzyme required for sulfatase activity